MLRHDLAEPVLLDVADAVARLTLNRPDSGNAIDAGFGRGFRATPNRSSGATTCERSS